VLIIADPEHLRQAAKQIIDNALQAGATRVTVRCRKIGGSVQWEFADNGPGLDPSIVADCLLPFRTTWSGHAGVGLALAQRTAFAHQGKIVVENQSAGGCLARITLPPA
jgi:signal transduction histidine kinase